MFIIKNRGKKKKENHTYKKDGSQSYHTEVIIANILVCFHLVFVLTVFMEYLPYANTLHSLRDRSYYARFLETTMPHTIQEGYSPIYTPLCMDSSVWVSLYLILLNVLS